MEECNGVPEAKVQSVPWKQPSLIRSIGITRICWTSFLYNLCLEYPTIHYSRFQCQVKVHYLILSHVTIVVQSPQKYFGAKSKAFVKETEDERASCGLLGFAVELTSSSFKSRKETVNKFPDWRCF